MNFGNQILEMLVALAVGGVAYLAARRWSRGQSEEVVPPTSCVTLEGFRGWLLLVAAIQCLAVVGAGGELVRVGLSVHESREVMELRALAVVAIVTQLAAFAFVSWTTVLMVRKRRLFPAALRLELVLLVVLPVLNLLVASLLTGTPVPTMYPWAVVAAWCVISTAFALPWFLYSLRSFRVRNTFVR